MRGTLLVSLALSVLPPGPPCDGLSALMGLEVASRHLCPCLLSTPAPRLLSTQSLVGRVSSFSSRTPHNWVFLQFQANGPVLELVSLTQCLENHPAGQVAL